MNNLCRTWRRGVLIAVLAAAGILWISGGKAKAAAEPEILGQEAVIYMDGKDEISVLGENIRSVTYTSSALDVAKVDGAGVVTPVKQGTAKIQVKVTYGETGDLQSKNLSYDLRVMDASTNYFTYDSGRITGLTARGKTLKDVYIPGYHNNIKITAVWKNVFDKNTAVEKVFLSEHLEYLDYYDWEDTVYQSTIFDGCSNLKELHIGKGLKNLGYMERLFSMQKVTVHPENPYFQVKDNVLFAGNRLVYYPAGRSDTSYTVPQSVTEIGEYAFSGAGRLTKIKLPARLKSIGSFAFEKTGLEEIEFPLNIHLGTCAFQECSKLQKAILPNRLNYSNFIFKNCKSLKTVIVPNTATAIYADSFYGCSSLQAFQIADGDSDYCVRDGVLFQKYISKLVAYPAGKKDTNYELPSNVNNTEVKSIERQAFIGAVNLKKIKLDSTLMFIGYGAFEDCRSLVSIRIPRKAILIGNVTQCFRGCRSLKEITVDSKNSFYSSVKGVLFDKSKKRVYCYPQAKKAKTFTLPGSVTRIARDSFSDSRYLQKLVMGNKVIQIEERAFIGARALKRITLSSRLKKIGNSAFEGCRKLQKIVIPSKVNAISFNMFSGCTALKEVVAGKSVAYVNSRAFKNCRSLQKLTFRGKKWMNWFDYDSVFIKTGSKNYSRLTVRVPKMTKKQRAKCKKVFRTAGLHKKAKIIFAK